MAEAEWKTFYSEVSARDGSNSVEWCSLDYQLKDTGQDFQMHYITQFRKIPVFH